MKSYKVKINKWSLWKFYGLNLKKISYSKLVHKLLDLKKPSCYKFLINLEKVTFQRKIILVKIKNKSN